MCLYLCTLIITGIAAILNMGIMAALVTAMLLRLSSMAAIITAIMVTDP